MNFLRRLNPFTRTTDERIAANLLYEAKCAAIEHRAAAEHHDALARMYETRIKRLSPAPVYNPDEDF
jgi:hypothetical protein